MTFVEKAAWAGDLPLEFAWAIHEEAPTLFTASYTFRNRTQALVNIKAFVVHALAKKTKSLFEGMISHAFVEGQERAITTDYEESSFDGLMENIRTGKLDQFFQRYNADPTAIEKMWKMADSYLLEGLKKLIEEQVDIVHEPDEPLPSTT